MNSSSQTNNNYNRFTMRTIFSFSKNG
jgi:hypothetical protein